LRLPRARLLAGVALALTAAAPASAAPAPPPVPGTIAVPTGHKPFLLAHAAGVQRYPCTTVPGGYAWGASTPRADLHDANGHRIGDHFGGPSWRAEDGSTVVAARDAGATVDPTAIPWLRLKRASATAGADGDRLVATTYIQRIATVGGLAPAADLCNALTVGTAVEVPYTADYLFWKEQGA
jgi:hypothetical protein